ncbi:MAG: hypothetical protein DHS20C02_20050 [Micavibrio sp.]|nr:MAG: hypothetical protein DHS20C02_20050 [Micavibrio sp.]
MNKKLIIFGIGELAELAYYYFKSDSPYEISAFTVDKAYIDKPELCGLPVVPYEDIAHSYPPDEYTMFIATGYTGLNALRKEKHLWAKNEGYEIASYLSSKAILLNDNKIGENCFIMAGCTVEPYVTIGDGVTLWSNSHIAHHSTIHDYCFIAPQAIIAGCTEIGEFCFIGANSTIRDHVKVGAKSVIGAGAIILSDVYPEGLYISPETERAAISSTKLKKI